MADVTVTIESRLNTNNSLQSALARGLLVAYGEATFSTYASGGVSMTVPGMNNVVYCDIESTAGFVFHYTPSSKSVLVYDQSGASGALDVVASGETITATAPFFALGYT
ncbi:MAG: hypothetical protein PHQ35_11370 [Phycisphaerae bacterium]|nr:hypothetical protein [Phycisphaerae bacterium]